MLWPDKTTRMFCRVFYAAVVILPTALIVVFSFILFSLGRKQFKVSVLHTNYSNRGHWVQHL